MDDLIGTRKDEINFQRNEIVTKDQIIELMVKTEKRKFCLECKVKGVTHTSNRFL